MLYCPFFCLKCHFPAFLYDYLPCFLVSSFDNVFLLPINDLLSHSYTLILLFSYSVSLSHSTAKSVFFFFDFLAFAKWLRFRGKSRATSAGTTH